LPADIFASASASAWFRLLCHEWMT